MKILFKKKKLLDSLFFLGLFIFLTVQTLQINKDRGVFNWKSELWADKAGYYMYLPATFFYHFDTRKCPEGIDLKTGYGFVVDREHNTFSTQYFYGVSLLVSPFFLAAHAVSRFNGQDEQGGFSETFNKFGDVAAVFYLVLGLFFLKKFLRNYYREYLQYFIILVTFFGTNLFFYTIHDGLMSHVYSFFTIALFLFAMKEFLLDQTRYGYFLLMAFAFGLMFIIRPTNCLVGIAFLIWDANTPKEIIRRLRLIILPKYLLPLIGIGFILMIPQMLYWNSVHGQFIYLKYGEKFINWNHPRLLEVWFSTLNGLVPWSPVNLIFIFGMLFMAFKRIGNGIFVLLLFLVVSYMAAAYRYWYFGCGYGHRAFVEFYPLFCVPFGFFIEKILAYRKRILKIIFALLVPFLVYVNLKLSQNAEVCFFGSTWDWDQYTKQLERINLYPSSARQFSFKNDFENTSLFYESKVTDTISNSGNWCGVLDKDHETCCEHTTMVWDFNGKFPEKVKVRLAVKKVDPGPIDAYIVCSFVVGDSVRYKLTQMLDPFVRDTRSWYDAYVEFRVPQGLTGDTGIKVYVWSKKRTLFFVDDLNIVYK